MAILIRTFKRNSCECMFSTKLPLSLECCRCLMTTNFTGFFINFFSEIMVNILHLSQKTKDDFVLSHTQSSRVERKYFEIQSYVYLFISESSRKKTLDGKKCHFQIKRILHLRLVQAKKNNFHSGIYKATFFSFPDNFK